MRSIFIELPNPDALPPGMGALADAIRELADCRIERQKAAAKQRELQAARPQALSDDRLATVKALREGKADPDGRITAALDKRIAQVVRQAEGWGMLEAEAEAALLAAATQHAAAHAAALAVLIDDARSAVGVGLAALTAAADDLGAAYALRGFLARATDADPHGVRYANAPTLLRTFGLKRVNGEPYTVQAVLEALRPLAEAPIEPEPPQVQPLAPRAPTQGVYVPRAGAE